ncbi:hypothetical protein EW146_g6214 [Bondarzewia mesenterica]|uniref:Zn(2)-C6 fungal-type domain-containing protein n=1 Tax=Bondarzewia mesenterica TaxID=1095465 RepID=A0A4S4LRB7_9AGAM|nr:hypothetical protein EW146_g6214 [Bondarzewia mesenterica]
MQFPSHSSFSRAPSQPHSSHSLHPWPLQPVSAASADSHCFSNANNALAHAEIQPIYTTHSRHHSTAFTHQPLHQPQHDLVSFDTNRTGGHTLSGSLDPSTGVFSRAPEHPRMRTAQACEKCRLRKAKCSGEHPVCQRCHTRGLVCEYAPERKMRGPNKPKPPGVLAIGSNSSKRSTTSRSPSGNSGSGETARKRALTLPSVPSRRFSPKGSPLTKSTPAFTESHTRSPTYSQPLYYQPAHGDEPAEASTELFMGASSGFAKRPRPPPLDLSMFSLLGTGPIPAPTPSRPARSPQFMLNDTRTRLSLDNVDFNSTEQSYTSPRAGYPSQSFPDPMMPLPVSVAVPLRSPFVNEIRDEEYRLADTHVSPFPLSPPTTQLPSSSHDFCDHAWSVSSGTSSHLSNPSPVTSNLSDSLSATALGSQDDHDLLVPGTYVQSEFSHGSNKGAHGALETDFHLPERVFESVVVGQ